MATHIVETNVSNLKINKLTQAQYIQAVQQGVIGDNELSIITDVVDGVVTVMPTPSASYEDTIVQFAGTTDANYTNGYFYKCVSDGAVSPTYSWENIEVQPAGSSLPDQTGNAGKFLTTDGTDASWSDTVGSELIIKTPSDNTNLRISARTLWGNPYTSFELYNGDTHTDWQFSISKTYHSFQLKGDNSAWLEFHSLTSGNGTGLPYGSKSFYPNYGTSYATDIMLGAPNNKWNTTYTTKISNGSDITVPNTAGTMVVTDYTGAVQGQVLTLDANGNAEWATPSSGGSVPTLTWYTISTAGTTLTIADTSSAQLVKIYKNGLLLQPTEDYTISGTTLTTVSAMAVGDKITTEVF